MTYTSYSIDASREAQYGNPPDGDKSNAGMHITWTFTFGDTVTITDASALASSVVFTLSGSTVAPTFSASGSTLKVDYAVPFAIFGGVVTIGSTDTTGHLLSGITVGSSSVTLADITSIVNTGLEIDVLGVTAGTDSTYASTTYKVVHSANVRSMNHIIWLSNGGSILGNANGGTSQSTVAHHHTFYNFTKADSAKSIVNNAAKTLNGLGYLVSDNGDGTFTITATTYLSGQVLAAATYDDAFLQKEKLGYGETVSSADMPDATDPQITTTSVTKDKSGKVSFQISGINDGWLGQDKVVSVDGNAIDPSMYTIGSGNTSSSLQTAGFSTEAVSTQTATLTIDDSVFDLAGASSKDFELSVAATYFPTATKTVTVNAYVEPVAPVTPVTPVIDNGGGTGTNGGTPATVHTAGAGAGTGTSVLPKTGDAHGMILFASILAASIGILGVGIALRRRNRQM